MKTKIFLVCSGLGNVQRGYESFARECFDELSKESSIDITLFKGGGSAAKKEILLWNIPRKSWIGIQLGRLVLAIGERVRGRRNYDAYYVEQAAFTLSLLPHIQRHKPDIIYFSDDSVGNFLGVWRRLTKQSYKLIFCDGGPMSPAAPRCDHVQRLAPAHFQRALDHGVPADTQTLLPLGFNISRDLCLLTATEKTTLRQQLNLPTDRPLVLSVGTIDRSHKRMDYVIQEVASLPEPRPYLLLMGQQSSESVEVIQLGKRLLGDNFEVRTVALSEIDHYYKVADCFVLASVSEGFGRVLVESMAYGLPCLAHDYEVTQFVVGKEGCLADFSQRGMLAQQITQVLASQDFEQCDPLQVTRSDRRHQSVYDRFSWDTLRPKYLEMFNKVL
ncbi:glycosyltransferase family 4 protein [Phormidesmis sp. 146-33]